MDNKVRELTDKQKLTAASALNLCMVSVSQIVDYNDINILEQEYNAILNNLNLKEMPKDQALLDILTKILDTITFFRIQEGDKKFIEKDYQQKMKSAIWSAVPNFGMLILGGLRSNDDIVGIALSIASQIGIGYMNYRKQKAQTKSEHEKEMWRLQRSAIEQFNALRRELFTTAWELAKKYDFEDRLRLTENQIHQYNEILMDPDDLRKYNRLDSIKDEYEAYPEFWYQMGHAANVLAINFANDDKNKQEGDNNTQKEFFNEKAKECFKKFEDSYIPLLRDDIIAASCYLEYIDVLYLEDAEKNYGKIQKLLQKAFEAGKKELDVLEQIAFQYIKLGALLGKTQDFDKACEYLKILINEDYNKIVNAQFLSQLYVGQPSLENERNWNELALAYNGELKPYLIPYDKEEDFEKNQKELLKEKVDYVIQKFFDKYEIEFNKQFPIPNPKYEYSDEYFGRLNRGKRRKDYKFAKKQELFDSYIYELPCYEQIKIINKMMLSLKELQFLRNNITIYADTIIKKLQSQEIQKLPNLTENDFKYEYCGFSDFSFESLFEKRVNGENSIIEQIILDIYTSIDNETSIGYLMQIETVLKSWADKENIPFYEIIANKKDDVLQDLIDIVDVFENGEKQKQKRDCCKEMRDIIENNIDSLRLSNKYSISLDTHDFSEFAKANGIRENEIVACLKKGKNMKFLFTIDGFKYEDKILRSLPYKKDFLDPKEYGKDIDVVAFNTLVDKLIEIQNSYKI